MAIAWDMSDDHIWYGKSTDDAMRLRLCLVAEHLPESQHWAWTVWQSDQPKILRRGIAPGAADAVKAVETAAACWRKIGNGDPRRMIRTAEVHWLPANQM